MPLLPPHWIAHLGHGCASRLGACAQDGRPEICRALASQVLADGRVEVLVARDVGAPVLKAIGQTGQVAYVATTPLTHRTLHVKGRDGDVAAAEPAHLPLLQACREAFLGQIAPLGFTRDQLMALWYGVEIEELACVRFTVWGAWDQTPGPGAGQAIELLA